MYRKLTSAQQVFDFYLPFGGKLHAENRWVILSSQIPWDEIDKKYSELFSEFQTGCPAIPARAALGALIIKERLGASDRETLEHITENPYLQFFLGYNGYLDKAPFHHTMMVHFRKRFGKDVLAEINNLIVSTGLDRHEEAVQDGTIDGSTDEPDQPEDNKGKMLVDATCTPADIPYPTDLSLLAEAREKTEEIIDFLHEPHIGQRNKPRTYRQKANKDYLKLIKQNKPSQKKIRAGIRKQLGFVGRNLRGIDKQLSCSNDFMLLNKRHYKLLLVIREVYRQQQWMYLHRTHRISDRIVNLYQPHVRPIVRGKSGRPVEFGAKISISLVDGFSTVDRLSWDAYNESTDLPSQIESYKDRYGFYPASVHADKIYRSRENRRYCKERNIRLSGPALGRLPKVTDANKEELKLRKRLQSQDDKDRQAVEGKFGQAKRRFTLGRIMAKLADTSEAVIMVSFMVMNLEKLLRAHFLSLFSPFWVVQTLGRMLRQSETAQKVTAIQFTWPGRMVKYYGLAGV